MIVNFTVDDMDGEWDDVSITANSTLTYTNDAGTEIVTNTATKGGPVGSSVIAKVANVPISSGLGSIPWVGDDGTDGTYEKQASADASAAVFNTPIENAGNFP